MARDDTAFNARDERAGAGHGAEAVVDQAGIPLIPGLSPSRRAFLKLVGFSFAGAALPGCSRGKERDEVPFLDRPETVTPGVSSFYATTCGGCSAGCGLLAKVRDGRPIKLEGNDQHPLSSGGTCAVGQAQVLSLYDSERLEGPTVADKVSSWEVVDPQVRKRLAGAKGVRLLTGTVNGPTLEAAIERFLAAVPGAKHVSYDALSCSALAGANEALYGERVVPHYRLEHAREIVSIDADFLGTWLSPVEFTRDYTKARRLEAGREGFARHLQFESRVSLTGSNADRRVRVAPSDLALVVFAIAERVARAKKLTPPWGSAPKPVGVEPAILDDAAKHLVEAGSGALVLCGLGDERAQRATAWLNHVLGADDPRSRTRTVDLGRPSLQARGDDPAVAALLTEIEAGEVGALVVMGCNPVYDLPDGASLGRSLKARKVGLVVSLSDRIDETAAHADFVCPDHHALESWGDAEPVRGLFTLRQPTIRPIFDTRAAVESLGAFSGAPAMSAFEQMRAAWRTRVFTNTDAPFERIWTDALHEGVVDVGSSSRKQLSFDNTAAIEAPPVGNPLADGLLDVVLYPKVGLLDGSHAHNPWLQELPDPVSKVSWDNYASLSPATAERLVLADGAVIHLDAAGSDPASPDSTPRSIELPVLVQRGQADDTVAIALGYGRSGTDRFARVGPEWIEGTPTVKEGETVGENAAPFLLVAGGHVNTQGRQASLKRVRAHVELARTQIYDSLDVPRHLAPKGGETRPMVQNTTLDAWRNDPAAGTPHEHPMRELWKDDHAYDKGRHWALAIDLSRCTGCASCVIACQSENNIPVVGKDEVRRQREMHWLRVDRYFSGDDDDLQTSHQPMMCQQCDHAPCETVCPVLATVHSAEGLNQQVYNRCVGTRYCSNNCPYKVRRFNWFDYAHEDQLQNLSLNPDVTVRSRGVMEKCTFCVQRIQEAKAEAIRKGEPVGDIVPACMQVCPADAIVFGDDNDKAADVSKWSESPRAYHVLGELGIQPSVAYLRRVKDRDEPVKEDHHG